MFINTHLVKAYVGLVKSCRKVNFNLYTIRSETDKKYGILQFIVPTFKIHKSSAYFQLKHPKEHWTDETYGNYSNYKRTNGPRSKFLNMTIGLFIPALALVGFSIIKADEVLCEENIKKNNEISKKLDTTIHASSDKELNERQEGSSSISKDKDKLKDDKPTEKKLPQKDDTKKDFHNLPTLPKGDANKSTENLPSSKFRVFSDSESDISLKFAVDSARNLINRRMLETGAPGIAIAVSINGKMVWTEGIGYQDIENSLKIGPYSVLRIASISKSLTMAGVGKLIDEGKLDIDAPIQKYVPEFPKKFVEGEEVTITTRHLLSHTSGIRHYSLKEEIHAKTPKVNNKKKDEPSIPNIKVVENAKFEEKDWKTIVKIKREKIKKLLSDKMFKEVKKPEKNEFDMQEYYIKEHFKNVKEALELFKEDELLFKPGNGFTYTTHGFTLVSAVIEGASGKSFTEFMKDLFKEMGLSNTYFDVNDDIIYRRSKHYYRTERSIVKNVPYVDNSYKWAGGGFLSTVVDLNKFGNIMLYSYQLSEEEKKENLLQHSFLKNATMKEMWKPVPNTKMSWDKRGMYALGWAVVDEGDDPAKYCVPRRFYASHTGGAVGASSVLLIYPGRHVNRECDLSLCKCGAQGIVVAVIANMQGVGLNEMALQIAKIFDRIAIESKVVGSIKGSATNQVYSLNTS